MTSLLVSRAMRRRCVGDGIQQYARRSLQHATGTFSTDFITTPSRPLSRCQLSPQHARLMSTGTNFSHALTDPASLMTYTDDDYRYGRETSSRPSRSSDSTKLTHQSSKSSAAGFSTLSSSLLSVGESEPMYNETIDTVPGGKPTKSPILAKWTPQLTKIVATIGPTSEQLPMLEKVVRSGMRIMRLNFSHATKEEVELRCTNLALCKGRHGIAFPDRLTASQNIRAVLLDTRGPEIRTGKLRNDTTGKETIELIAGESITLRTSTQWQDAGSTASDLFIDYPDLAMSLSPGMKVLLDDGAATLTVERVDNTDMNTQLHTVTCRIENSAELRSRAGVNLPGAKTSLPAITEKDKADIKYGLTKDIDYIAASFVQNAQGVKEIKNYVRHVMTNDLHMDPKAPAPLIISKIESVSGLLNFDEILMESDGIMVARGDLGVEIPIQQVTNAQKEMIAACNAVGKPVIVATQMLESMAKNPRPTRAEVADVSNAVYDGADCVMLSGETAKGNYPVESVKMMNEIILGAECFAKEKPQFSSGMAAQRRNGKMNPMLGTMVDHDRIIPQRGALSAVAMSAVTAAEDANVKAIIVMTFKGYLPRLISAYRPNVPIIAFCQDEKLCRQLMINRGVHPVLGLRGTSKHKKQETAMNDSKSMGFVSPGDVIVIVGVEKAQGMGNVASMKVVTVPEDVEDLSRDMELPPKEEVKIFPPCV